MWKRLHVKYQLFLSYFNENWIFSTEFRKKKCNVKLSRYGFEQAFGGSGRLRTRICMTFGTMKVVRSSPLRTGRLYPQEFSWYPILDAESTPGHMVPSVASEKKIPSDTTGDRSFNVKFHQNPSSRSRVVPCERTEGRTNGHDEGNSRFTQF
jgi:hypothetical protein